MQWYWAALILFGLGVGLMMTGVPVAIAFFATNIVAAALFMGGAAGIMQVINNGFGAMTNFALVPIPMFLLMGELFFHTGLAGRCFNAADKLLGNVPARLSFVTLIGGTAFAGPAGSSMGSCALLGSLMVPEMYRRGYSKYLSIGPIMGVGGLAVIIPPSALTVLLATLGRTDVGDLLIAGVVPGFVLALMYGILIYGWTVFDPTAAPQTPPPVVSRREKWRLVFVDVIPMVAIIVFSVLIMIVGWCTPTEAAALGALSVIVLAACYGEMTWKGFLKSLEGSLRVTVMAFLIIFGSATFAQVLAFTGASSGLMNWALGFPFSPLGMLLIMIGVIFFLGCFMDQLSMMLLTAPIFFPLAKTLGFDLVWFGLIMLLALEIGYTTPPFGLLLFVMKGVAPPGTTMRDIYLAGMPFIGCVLLLIALIIVFPPLATWLPAISH
ncbi:MAG: TRAP transporter large permease subunit [Betaproteobacteria bacterium]|nr:MAG: TRAP transporter large permease subunit [Betaproteobacteria bacterium]TMH45021.1 MAG: TRAP transporter large permease subunit [Betaproteobacteria bacterium]